MENCLFCKIVAREMQSNEVLDRGAIFAFRDINPAAPTHILIVPKEHIRDVSELTEDHAGLLGEIYTAARELAAGDGIDKSGYRIVANTGSNAGQSVFHLHFHLLGGRRLGWPPG